MKARLRDGFTLGEVLIAMAISSVLVLGVTAAYRQIREAGEILEKRSRVYERVRVLTELLREEIVFLYGPDFGDGEDGDVFGISSEGDGNAEMFYFTVNPSWKRGTGTGGCVRVRYEFCEDEGDGKRKLVRYEQAYSGGDAIGEEERSEIEADGLVRFEVWAFDGEERKWREVWTDGKRIPVAVRVELVWEGIEDVVRMTVPVGIGGAK